MPDPTLMLNREEIEGLGLISENFEKACLRNAGYDLRIESLISKAPGDEKMRSAKDEVWIEPQGIVAVVSKETIKLPKNICAYASVKTSLCRDGILAINIGIIDPGWEGPISSVLLNFGKEKTPIKNGDLFLRLTFHPVNPCPSMKPTLIDRSVYENNIQGKFESRLASSFMDLSKAAEKGSEKFSEDFKRTLLKYIPIGALMLTFITFLLNYGVLSIAARAIPQDVVQLRAEALIKEQRKEIDGLQQRLKSLEEASKIPPLPPGFVLKTPAGQK